jgi:class 3 adenylate cyclase/tetratricopeptide (TPR) repeat protein/DNA-binding XRE family transcriptional regulator
MPGFRRLRGASGTRWGRVMKDAERGTFAELLRQHRTAAGLTQEALADRAGLSVRGIADLERGARRYPHFHTLRSLAQALELASADRVALLAAGHRPARAEPTETLSTPMQRCRRCGRDNGPKADFCVDCGAPLEVPCPACGARGGPADRFCHACGASRTASVADTTQPEADGAAHVAAPPERAAMAEGEHKQATVLFCQLADSTALARRLGTDRMLAFLDSFFEQAEAGVRRFEGTVSSYLSDGLVALFGVPVAHEDHARRGVLAALGLQRRLSRQAAPAGAPGGNPRGMLRMALNTGLVAVSQIGSGPERRLSAVGETTTVAGLLQQQAEPGTIVIGPATARMVTGYVRLEELGPLQLPGVDGSVTAFRVTGTGSRRSPIEGLGARPLSQFVGRELEMKALHNVLEQVAVAPELSARPTLGEFIGREADLAALRGPLAKVEAGHGQVVGIVGEPGIGKSRLLYEFRRSLADRKISYLEGRCLSYGGSIPYLPIVDVVRANCGIVETDAPEVVVQKVRFGLHEVGLDADRDAPCMLHLLGLGEGVAVLTQLSAEALKLRIFETLRAWSLHGSRRRPLIIAVEDLHWIDRSSEEYLASLAESVAGAPILLVCTWRPGYRAPWAEHSYVTQLGLRRLGPRDSLSVVCSVLGADRVPETLARVILERGEGNPFFLEELARAVLDRGAAGTDRVVPDTIQGVLMARMDRLAETPRQLLQTASVLGREVPLRLLAAIWPQPAALPEHLRALQHLEFIYEQAGREPGFVFKHALTQDVAYETLLEGRRRALHAAAGRAMETLYADRLEEVYDRLAHHYSRTDDAVKAVRYLTGFAARAAGMHAHSEAARALEDALEHIAGLPADGMNRQLVDIAVRLAASYYFLGRFPDTVELLNRHCARMEQLGDRALAGRFFFELAHAHSHLGDYRQAVACAERAIEEAQHAGDASTRGKAHYVLCKESMWVSRFRDGLQHGRRAVKHLESTGERWWLGQSLCWQGINLYFMGDLNAALECAAGGFAIGEQLGDHRLQSYAAWNRAWFSATRGDGQDAINWGHRSIELSPDPLNSAFSLGWTGYAYLEHGHADRAISLLEQSIELLEGMRYSRLVGWFRGWLATAYLLAGNSVRARDEALAGLQVSAGTGFTWAVGLAQRALGDIARADGDNREAVRCLNEALHTFEATESRFDAARTHLKLAELVGQHGQHGGRAAAAAHRQAARRLLAGLGLSADTARARELPARG